MKILVVQNRMGIGDLVIFMPFIEAIAKKYEVPVSCLVKENSKANEIFKDNKYIKELIFLERGEGRGNHDGIIGSIKLISKLKKYKFDKVFIFNSSFRFYTISILAGISEVFHYPLLKKKQQHIIHAAQRFIKETINTEVESNPIINISEESILLSKRKFKINSEKTNILLGIGGSGPTKRVPAKIFIKSMELICKNYECNFYLATGNDKEEQKILNDILSSSFNDLCIPLDKHKISDILPVIKNCKISICNDSSFSHLSAALGLPTIVLMTDTPLIYGSYSPRMYPIIPDGEKSVSHNTLGKDKINPLKIFLQFKEIIN
ncbi:MAG: lipopolysaccharide heptosyltransferase family protein [Candidatus Pelagibacter sp. TMED118]|nr:MAG: lipopolysaccharide heptosyltransferase family protein [Candidatus Pelagibacter sp. TMED118]